MHRYSTYCTSLTLMLFLGGLLALAGCDTTGGTRPNAQQSGVDPRLTGSHSAQFFSRSGANACLGAAAVGALACQLSNASNKDRCMIQAAIVACGVAMGANYYLDHRRAQYANTEDRLDAYIADVRKDNQQLQALSATARQVIADDRRAIEQIKRDIAANRVQQAQAHRRLAEIDANTRYLQGTLANVRAKEQEWIKVAQVERRSGGQRVDMLDAEINRMRQHAARLEAEIDQLYSQRSAIRLG